MGSSNRHWPSMFKSKPSTTSHHLQWQPNPHHDLINPSLISSSTSHRPSPYTPGPGCEERTPEPKPRWNPRPEQIRILESIFNSGMVNPPRDEIRKIRVQLQEYGQVGDANVFYWFQNRKSRSKHKLRQLQNNTKSKHMMTTTTKSSSSSTSSSDKSSSHNNSNEKVVQLSVGSSSTTNTTTTTTTHVMNQHHDLLINSPTASVNQNQQQQPFFQGSIANDHFLSEPFFFPVVQQQQNCAGAGVGNLTQGFGFVDDHVTNDHDQNVGNNCTSFLLSHELMLMNNNGVTGTKKDDENDLEKMKLQEGNLGYSNLMTSSITAPIAAAEVPIVPPSICHVQSPTNNYNINLQGVGEHGPTKSTVFINDVCFEVGLGPFNVREAFGDDAVLIQSTGHPVLTNDWGLTLDPLRHGAFYYLVRTASAFTPTPDERCTIDLI